jgi:hypothetical protein
MRRDEGDGHRVETPNEHGPPVREVVAGRARRGRADDAVAAEPAECFAADCPFELDHPADDGTRDDEVVDSGPPLVSDFDLESEAPRRCTRRRRREPVRLQIVAAIEEKSPRGRS